MTFAFGQRTREQVVKHIANLRSFEHGGISGKIGGCRDFGHLPRQYVQGLSGAYYVVYCYGTPIAWVAMADEATEEGRCNFMPDWQYSATTTYYQGLVWEAWGDKIADPDPRFSRESNRGTARGRASDERYGRVPRRAPVERPVSARRSLADDRMTVQQSMRAAFAPAGFAEQDELIDEVLGYRHPAHP